MKYKNITLLILLFSNNLYASDSQLIDEKEIIKWGYSTQTTDYKPDTHATIKEQLIRSLHQAKGLEHHYYYYKLSEECFKYSFIAKKEE